MALGTHARRSRADGSLLVRALFGYADLLISFVSLRAFDQNRRGVPPVLYPIRRRVEPGCHHQRGDRWPPSNRPTPAEPSVFCSFADLQRSAIRTRHPHGRPGERSGARRSSWTTWTRMPPVPRLEGVLGRATVVSLFRADWINSSHRRDQAEDPHSLAPGRSRRSMSATICGCARRANWRRCWWVLIRQPSYRWSISLRWPGSWNCKTTPRLSTIAAYDATAEINLSEALEALETAIEAAGWASADIGAAPSGTPEADIAVVRSAMAMIPNVADDVHYAMWVRLGYAVHRATGGTAEGFGVWDTWSKVSDKYDADETFRTWRRIRAALSGKNPPRTIGAGTIFYLAAQHGWIRQPPLFEHSQARAREAEAESDDDEPASPQSKSKSAES